jgi:hypothetical protein
LAKRERNIDTLTQEYAAGRDIFAAVGDLTQHYAQTIGQV